MAVLAKVGMVSLGCPKNLVDSEHMLGLLVEAGYEVTADAADADVLIVNTCGFIEEAKRESVEAVLDMARFKADGRCRALIVAGCLAERYRMELLENIPEADGIMGVGAVADVCSVVAEALAGRRPVLFPAAGPERCMPRVGLTPRHTAYLRIADGCSNRCSYCAIPGIRGPLRSKPLDLVLGEASSLAESGVMEVVLVAQDCTAWGTDIYGRPSLHLLVRRLAAVSGFHWIRLMYCHPSRVTDDLIEVMAATPKVCHYLDVPVQHASARILRLMKRPHDAGHVLEVVGKLRRAMPDVALRTTYMVGFPGETERDFSELLAFMKEARFDRAGVFVYSPEEGTPAASLGGRVPERTKRDRYRRAMSLQRTISRSMNRRLVGSRVEVLVERRLGPTRWLGRTWRDAPEVDGVAHLSGPAPAPGTFVPAVVASAGAYDIHCTVEEH
ncbi:MAG: 30S ribosomal protein S12 methylthiotransferase RimO [Firmicutes bacterium]|jgi:ribosomal protein S12 methylthiotransferase|nr:30S ribosomal protein S12 methylthiotransferase RimO [Bacillota bacterium]